LAWAPDEIDIAGWEGYATRRAFVAEDEKARLDLLIWRQMARMSPGVAGAATVGDDRLRADSRSQSNTRN